METSEKFLRGCIHGAIGGFLYYFVVKALNADIDAKYRKTKSVQYLCGIFTVAVALTIHTWVATLAWFTTYLGPRIGEEAAIAAVTAYQDGMLPAIAPMYGDMNAFVEELRGMGFAEVMHARLIRTQTKALGGSYCDYWYVGDKSPVLEQYKDLEQI